MNTTRTMDTATTSYRASDSYGSLTFSGDVMLKRLPPEVFMTLQRTVRQGLPLDPAIANTVAAAMKDWAIEHGATHYCHWFQPLTGTTAEKHDAFLSPASDGSAIEKFSGSQLIQGEPDASSFPSGGIRDTYEARGYTAWDCTSPAFILRTGEHCTLCIPTAFVSWTGEALDKKTPLLRSIQAVSKQAMRILKIFGTDAGVNQVNATLGCEQEYFLVDRELARERLDLSICGRTLVGAAAPKGQQLEDHYFGSIPERVLAFMSETEARLFELGIPVKTRHNEVAPGQYEIAPTYENANVASDHQMLTMHVLRSVAATHGFECLMHEKPFAGVNGSGKHVNWSLSTDLGHNLLDPREETHTNMQFLVFLAAVLRAVDENAELLRASIAGANNDHRLGANEAPPAILSVYLGTEIEAIFGQIKDGKLDGTGVAGVMDLGLSEIIPFAKDSGDRNRTSPFAFTGNRFEFRAVGAQQSVSGPLIAMNTILADSLGWIGDKLEAALGTGMERADAVIAVLKEVMTLYGGVVFGGNGYSPEWHRAAVEERGLLNLPTTADALPYLQHEATKALFSRTGVLTERELKSRYEVYAETYVLTMGLEAKLAADIAKTIIYPSAMKYLAELTTTAASASALGIEVDTTIAKSIATNANAMLAAVTKLAGASARHDFESKEAHMDFCASELRSLIEELRVFADALEMEVSDTQWPLPKYREMLFIK